MPTPRKLTAVQERDACLAYLCAVDREYVAKHWHVSYYLVRDLILRERSLDWGDPLAELYRKTDQRDRERNALHLILAFNDAGDLPHMDLIDREREKTVYDVVKSQIYNPRRDAIIQQTSLNRYLHADITGLDLLLSDVNPAWRTPEGIIDPLLIARLRQEYGSSHPCSMDEVCEELTSHVLGKVKQGALAMTTKKSKFVGEVLGTLLPRHEQVLSLSYGLSGKQNTLEEIGEVLEVTRERVRKIQEIALNELRSYHRSKKLGYVAGLVTDAEVEEYLVGIWKEETKERLYLELRPAIEAELRASGAAATVRIPPGPEYAHKPLAELGLIEPVLRRLQGGSIKNIGDLCTKKERELLKIHQFGRKSLREVKEQLARKGLSLAGE